MRIDIQAHDFPITDGLRAHVERRVRGATARLDGRVQRVEVRLFDLNGPRGGVDKGCRLHLRLGGLPDIVVEDVEDDLYAAVTRSAARAQRSLKRRLHRTREGQQPHTRLGMSAPLEPELQD